jgi:hypothetical protein
MRTGMFARVVTYAGGDPTRVDEIIAAFRYRNRSPLRSELGNIWKRILTRSWGLIRGHKSPSLQTSLGL